jgi:hypothetical protein
MSHERMSALGRALLTGTSYTHDKIVPFAKSLRVSGFNGPIIIGVTAVKGKLGQKRVAMADKW